MFRRVGNKFFCKGIRKPLLTVEPSVCLIKFTVEGFNIIVAHNRLTKTCDLNHYVTLFADAKAYATELKEKHPDRSADFFYKLWGEEEKSPEHYDWMKQNVWNE